MGPRGPLLTRPRGRHPPSMASAVRPRGRHPLPPGQGLRPNHRCRPPWSPVGLLLRPWRRDLPSSHRQRRRAWRWAGPVGLLLRPWRRDLPSSHRQRRRAWRWAGPVGLLLRPWRRDLPSSHRRWAASLLAHLPPSPRRSHLSTHRSCHPRLLAPLAAGARKTLLHHWQKTLLTENANRGSRHPRLLAPWTCLASKVLSIHQRWRTQPPPLLSAQQPPLHRLLSAEERACLPSRIQQS